MHLLQTICSKKVNLSLQVGYLETAASEINLQITSNFNGDIPENIYSGSTKKVLVKNY